MELIEKLARALAFVDNGDGFDTDWECWTTHVREQLPIIEAHVAEALAAKDVQIAGLREALRWFVDHARSIRTDVQTAHSGRDAGASQWMREDDRDFKRDLVMALEIAQQALAKWENADVE